MLPASGVYIARTSNEKSQEDRVQTRSPYIPSLQPEGVPDTFHPVCASQHPIGFHERTLPRSLGMARFQMPPSNRPSINSRSGLRRARSFVPAAVGG